MEGNGYGKGAAEEEEMCTERGGRNRKGPPDKRGRRWKRKIRVLLSVFHLHP